LLVLVWTAAMQGCATTGGKTAGQRLDPWEHWNRKVFSFNEKLDAEVLKPVAQTYSDVVPRPVRRGVDNFFGNVADAWSAINNFLQGKFDNGFRDVIRVGTNTVFGLGGVFDVATEFGVDHQYEDFGQTLGHWGFGPGAYVVWPVLGPSSVRESFAMPLDLAASPALLISDGAVKWEITTLQFINKRANLLGATAVLDDIALDKYTFVRDAYLQRRRSLVKDGSDSADDGNADGDEDERQSAPAASPADEKPADEKPHPPVAPASAPTQ